MAAEVAENASAGGDTMITTLRKEPIPSRKATMPIKAVYPGKTLKQPGKIK
jgi:hypothetical protein